MEYTDKLLGEKKMQVHDYDEHLKSREHEANQVNSNLHALKRESVGENVSGALNPKVGGY